MIMTVSDFEEHAFNYVFYNEGIYVLADGITV